MHPAIQGLLTIAFGVVGCVAYFYLANLALDQVFCPARGKHAGRNINRANLIRPWLFLLPAVAAMGLYLVYPVVETLRLSLSERLPGNASQFVGLDNYAQMVSEDKFWEALTNNLLWLLIVPAFATAFGLLAAQLSDRVRWGNLAKSLIFMPMAISFVGAAVIWKLVYDARPLGQEQIGILNALYLALGGGAPATWLTIPFWNSFFLMAILIWIQTGFAMVILSAALRGIPEETVEAAIVDGANPFQLFFRIKVPQIKGTIVVVWTTITIVVLKVFDIVFAMTNGQWETQVLANYMYDKLFRANDWGVGSAGAIVILLLVTPILVWNVASARKEMR
ncbi:MAG: sugar ABC transporter permease [Pseudomonadota bacterium]